MREGRLGYNSYNKRYGLLSSDLWIDTGFHCGECLEVLLDDEWVQAMMEMNPAREQQSLEAHKRILPLPVVWLIPCGSYGQCLSQPF